MATKAAKARVEEYAQLFRPFYGKQMQIQATNSDIKPFSSILTHIRVATLADMAGLEPDKRAGRTPTCMLVEFADGKLFFILDDIANKSINLRSIVFTVGDREWKFVEVV